MKTPARLAAALAILAALHQAVCATDCRCDRVSIKKLDLQSFIYPWGNEALVTDSFTIADETFTLAAPSPWGGSPGQAITGVLATYQTPEDFSLPVENDKPFQLRLGSREDASWHRAAITFGCGVTKVRIDGTELSVLEKDEDIMSLAGKYTLDGKATLKREGCRVVLEILGSFDMDPENPPSIPVEINVAPFKPKKAVCTDNDAAPPPSAEALPAPAEASGQPPGADLKASFFAGTGTDGISPGPIQWTAATAESAVGLASLRVPGLENDGSLTPNTYVLAGTDPRPAKASRLQLKTQTALFDAQAGNDTLTLRFFNAQGFTTPDLDADEDDEPDFYDTDGATPLKTVTYSRTGTDILVSVDGHPTHMLSITTVDDTTTTSWASLAESRRTVTARDTSVADHPVVTREEWSGLGAGSSVLLSRTVNTFELSAASPDGFRLQERVRRATAGGASAADETETFHYGTGDTVSLRVSSDGSWETNGTTVPQDLANSLHPGPTGATLLKTTVTGRPWLDGDPPTAGDPPSPSGSVVEVVREFTGDTTISETFTDGVLSGRAVTTKDTDEDYDGTITTSYLSSAAQSTSETWTYATGSDRGRLYQIISPGGLCTTYGYTPMAFDDETGSFVEDEEGTFLMTSATRGTIDHPEGLADEEGSLTTRTLTIRDADGLVVREETQAYTGSGYETMTATAYAYDMDASGRVTKTTTSRDGRVISEVEEGGGDSSTTTDEEGRVMIETRDNHGRLSASVDKGGGGQPDITTSYTYSGLSATVVRSVPGLQPMVSSTTRNLLGETVSSTDEAGTVTTWTHNQAGRTETTARNGVERITSTFRDGRFKSESGNGVVARRATYSVDVDGFITTIESTGPVAEGDHSPRWTATTTDWTGRTVKTTTPGTPGPAGTNDDVLTSIEYDAAGRAWKTSTNSSPAPRLFLSDALGMTVTSGLDITADDALDLTGADRFTTETRRYQPDDGQWWEVVTRTTPLDANNAYSITTRTLMDASAGDTMETVATAGGGVQTASETTTRTCIRATKTSTTETVAAPGGTTTTVEANGLVVSRAIPDGQAEEKCSYDGFRRLVRTTDSRGGTAARTYDAKGHLTCTTDRSGHARTYAYFGPGHVNAGLVSIIKEQNAGEATTTYTYNALGQTEEVAGSATYKQSYTYDDFGDPHTLTTYRSGTQTATTTWSRDPATGLVTRKEYQDGKGTNYTYTADGLPATRTWERGVTTTWTYADGSRDLAATTYSDTTPAVAYTNFDRLGRPGKVVEKRSETDSDTTWLSYDPASGAESVHYDADHSVLPGVLLDATDPDDGRPTGYEVKVGTNTTPVHGWNYDDDDDALGRVRRVSGHGLDTTLGYYPGTGLLHEQVVQSGQDEIQRRTRHIDLAGRSYGVVNRAPDPDNNDASRTVASIAHAYDDSDRRITARREDGTVWTYGYNDRSEVTSAEKRAADETLVPGLVFGYDYDGIGNRLTASRGSPSATAEYTPNAVNQYSEITYPGSADILVRSADSVTVGAGGQTLNASAVDTFHGARITGDNDPDGLFLPMTITSGTFSETGHIWLPPASLTPTYDADGNQTDDGRWIHTWDAENRLVRMEVKASAIAAGAPNQTIDYTYDFRSRRIGRKATTTVGTTSTTTETRYLYEGWNCVAEFSPLETSGLKLDTSYVWSLDLSGTLQGAGGVGGLLSVCLITDNQQQITLLPAYDANGNIIAWTDTTGRLVQRQDYDAFGNTVICERLAIDAATSKRLIYGFSTKPLDPDTGLHYYGYRWYGARDAMWRSRDPMGEGGGSNLHAMLGNNCTNLIDYLGLADILVEIVRTNYEWDTLSTFTATATDNALTACALKVKGQLIELKKGNYSLVPDPRYRGGNIDYPIPAGKHPGQWSPSPTTSMRTIVSSINAGLMENHTKAVQAYNEALRNNAEAGPQTFLDRLFGWTNPRRTPVEPGEITLYAVPVGEIGVNNILINAGGGFSGTRMHIGQNCNWSRGCPIVGRNARLLDTQIAIYDGHVGEVVKLHNFEIDDSIAGAYELGRLVLCVTQELKGRTPSIEVQIR